MLRRIWPDEKPAAAPRRTPAATPAASGPELLERWRKRPRFAELLERPVDDQSERDFAVACFALEHGAEVEEAKRLMQAARLQTVGDAKAMRADYLERTIASAQEKTREKRGGELAGELSELLGLGHEQRVLGVQLYGRGSRGVAYIQLASGNEIVLDTIGRYSSVGSMTAELAVQAGSEPELKAKDVVRILRLIHDLAEHYTAHEREDQAADLGFSYLRAAQAELVDMADQASRWRAFNVLDTVDPVSASRAEGTSVATGSVVLEDEKTGLRYVRVTWFKAYVRQQAAPGEAEAISRAMQRLGWTKPGSDGQIKATAPGRADTLHWAFFVVPRGWEHR